MYVPAPLAQANERRRAVSHAHDVTPRHGLADQHLQELIVEAAVPDEHDALARGAMRGFEPLAQLTGSRLYASYALATELGKIAELGHLAFGIPRVTTVISSKVSPSSEPAWISRSRGSSSGSLAAGPG
jgi:hypothetical protein